MYLLNIMMTLFSVGDTADSHTLKISYRVGNWLGSGECCTIIDTPGMIIKRVTDICYLALQVPRILKEETITMLLKWHKS